MAERKITTTAKDVFGLIVRVIGLLIAMLGICITMANSVDAFDPLQVLVSAKSGIIAGLVTIAAGLLLMRGASWVSVFAYPIASSSKDLEAEASPLSPEQPAA
jgi:hypothetical protein